jgi:hypothetical protein
MTAIAHSAGGLPRAVVWLPLMGLAASVWGVLACLGRDWPAWTLMWITAGAVFAGLKWLTFADGPAVWRVPVRWALGYLLLWPGMDARAFFSSVPRVSPPSVPEWWLAAAKVGCGLLLIFAAVPLAAKWSVLLAGSLGMAGIVFVLHFGVFHLLSLAWRRVGVDAPPIMDGAVRSRSLAEFWGRRWNRAFRDVAYAHVFRPLVPRVGATGASLAVFAVSGVVHELMISVPAGAGWGLPTLYFLIQGAGTLFERTRTARGLGLGRGITGWLFCALVTVAPVGLLFHRPFIERVVLPMLAAMGAL